MPRPSNKKDLLLAIDEELAALEATLAALSPEQMTAPGLVGTWSAKDVLAHLAEWQQMALGWYRAGLKGQTPDLPAPGYTWGQIAQLNQMIYEKYRELPLNKVKAQFQASHKALVKVIQKLSEPELFKPGHFAWTGRNTLGGYFTANTSSHYAWARNAMRKKIKAKPV